MSDLVVAMRRAPQPFIAAIRGPVAGGGFALALACDVRIAGESARFNAAFIRIGLSACDMGVSYFLPRAVGSSVASELMLTGRFINAQRAFATGLVSELMPDGEVDAAAPSRARDDGDVAARLAADQGMPVMSIDAGSLEQASQSRIATRCFAFAPVTSKKVRARSSKSESRASPRAHSETGR